MLRAHRLAAATLTAAALSLAPAALAFADTAPGVPADRPITSVPADRPISSVPMDKPADLDATKSTDKGLDKSTDKSSEKSTDKGTEKGSDKSTDKSSEKSWEKDKSSDKDKSWSDAERRPHGGVHTGGGFGALGDASMTTGAVLLAGGLGVGALALRRRKPSSNRAA
ncbi:hypothetical protein [Kitasatospora azatica]|uniref:hypothetical protein n=1 Tax=Kitasatospora azatica TaxID=58347 RepID=UPI00068C7FCE|nr:hypothetical protein [Kitasatospora azatica]